MLRIRFSRSLPLLVGLFATVGLTASGCDTSRTEDNRFVTAVLTAPSDTTTGVSGIIRLAERDGRLRIEYDVSGLAPGAHGLHVHENASCAPADVDGDGAPEAAGAAGGHYDPLSTMNHAGVFNSRPAERHLGDFGNITANENGRATGRRNIRGLQLSGTLSDTAYDFTTPRAIIVHSDRDDIRSEPGGNSGERIGCGLFEANF